MIIGLDVGGTNTDVVLLGDEGVLRQIKVPTEPDNLLNSVWTGLEEVIKGISPEKISRAVLSTTLTTNAIAERKIPEVGMIVSAGPGIDPKFFKTCKHYFNVEGSIDHRGREISSINKAEIKTIADIFEKHGIKNVGVVSKFSTRNPKHEIEIKEALGDRFDYVILGHNLSGSLNFPRRIATTYLNAAVYPVHKRFFEAVQTSLKKHGLSVPIYILKADAGTMNFKSSLNVPGQTILSGPAASVMGSLPYVSGNMDSLVLDIGGTTTDMAVFVDKAPLLDPFGIELGGYKTLIRSLRTHSIGLGGDSRVRVKEGNITIGPDRKGPAMAFGGPEPTPTDALFVLDKTKEGNKEASIKGFEILAKELNLSIKETATKVFDLACQKIFDAAHEMIREINSKPVYTIHDMHEGLQVKPKEILVLGGPAQYFASRLDELSDYKVRVVPKSSVANAIGAAIARTTCQVTLFADTDQGVVSAPEENFYQKAGSTFNEEDAVKQTEKLLKEKALRRGATEEELEIEIVECSQFNMVRGFYTAGRNIRVKMQVKPGLIQEAGSYF
ncbi:Hydantoinase/oxoprolinase [Candidatus Magnetomoraceae bacterium gMMP-13]